MILFRIRKIYWYLELIIRLGIWDVLYVGLYRIMMKSGILKRKYPVIEFRGSGQLFNKNNTVNDFPDAWKTDLIARADKITRGSIPYYYFHWINQQVPPRWFINPFNGKECLESSKHWTEISDFNSNLGDIKHVWETSRYTWVSILARAYAVSGKDLYLDTVNEWISDWIKKNPVNQGPNWKCGQEASMRVFNLLNASMILNQSENPSDSLREIIKLHLKRIYKNRRYAFAQRNNHATSEAAALFVGGSWLAVVDTANKSQHLAYAQKGRDCLERLARKLFYEDGSFAQHSMYYHRLILDTLSIIMYWKQKLNLSSFTKEFNEIACKSIAWMQSVLDKSGKCPNLGANDGTMLLGNHSCDYLDFRPSLQAASVLVNNKPVFENGPWNEVLYWFGIKNYFSKPSSYIKKTTFHQSGYVIMSEERSWALLRFPFYKFRPSHNDVFHFDLWANGINLLFDSGTYSYNPDQDSKVPDLKSVHAHNTLSFDHQEQMPRLGRFLLARWIQPLEVGAIERIDGPGGEWEGSYMDSLKNLHFRRVRWENKRWELLDRFSGSAQNVEIGFNFDNCKYSLDHKTNSLLLPWGQVTISDNAEIKVCEHIISTYYMHSSAVNRLVISTRNNSEVTTSIDLFL